MVRTITAAIAILGITYALRALPADAQSKVETVEKIIEGARRTNPALKIRIDPRTGLPTSINGLRPAVDPGVSLSASRGPSGQPTEDDIRAAAEAFFKTGALSAAFNAENDRTKIEAFRVRKDPDIPGQSVVHVEQRVDGIRVFGSSGRVVVGPSLAVTQLAATFSNVEIESTTPDIKQERAIEVARMHLRAILSDRQNDPELEQLLKSPDRARSQATLVIYEPALMRAKGSKQGPARLAWLITIDAFRFFVDAKVGDVLFYYLDQRKSSQQRVFDLEQRSNFPGTKVLDDIAGKRIKPLPRDAEDAHTNAGLVIDYFANVFGRAGLLERGADETLSSYVRFGNSKNAYWCINQTYYCPQAGAMVYGEGYPAALDIVGHEMTHGMITVEADLTYANESGAVNESLADIFGTLIEFATNPGTANWVLGDKLRDQSLTKPLRSISNPNLSDGDGNALFDRSKVYGPNNRGQPDHYADYVTREDPICETTRDWWYGCVHFNSGIFNKFAFLVAEGGRHRGSVVLGIGREKLGRVAYRSLVTHLNPSTGLREAAEAFLTACSELAGARVAGFVSTDCDRMRKAQDAVGLTIAGS